jgi:hypothetical protein
MKMVGAERRIVVTEMVTPSPRAAARQGAEAMSRFPSASDDDQERRALKAALHVAELKRARAFEAAARTRGDAAQSAICENEAARGAG